MAQLDWEEWILPWNWTVRAEMPSESPVPNTDCPGTLDLVVFGLTNLTDLIVAVYRLYQSWVQARNTVSGPQNRPNRSRMLLERLLNLGFTDRGRPHRRKSFFQTVSSLWRNAVKHSLGPWLGRRAKGVLYTRHWVVLGSQHALRNLISNLITAYITRNWPGYGNTPVGYLTLLWYTRPRMEWIVGFYALTTDEDTNRKVAGFVFGEFLMQCLGTYSLYLTADEGRRKGFYYVGSLTQFWRGAPASRMYSGALFWVVACWVFIPLLLAMLYYIESFLSLLKRLAKELNDSLFRRNANQNTAQEHGQPLISQEMQEVDPDQNAGQGQETRLVARIQEPDLREQPRRRRRTVSARGLLDRKTALERAKRLLQHDIDNKTRKYTVYATMAVGALSFVAQWLFWEGFNTAAGER
ncbi:hypothetical protein MMC10_001373 [Thelotrema lepadinum]|nr:hypothetical protein [Thelotrema lepadinum]